MSPELIELLKYMEHSTDEVSEVCKSERIQKMHRRICQIKASEKTEVKYMQSWEEKILIKQEGIAEGRLEGKLEEKQELMRKLSNKFSIEQIAEMLERPIGTIQWIYNTSIKKLKYIFTSLFMVAILTGGTFIFRFISYIQAIMAGGANSTLPSEKNTSLQLGIVILLGVCFLAELIIFIVLYKKTDKIPTKVDKKII